MSQLFNCGEWESGTGSPSTRPISGCGVGSKQFQFSTRQKPHTLFLLLGGGQTSSISEIN